MLGGRWSTVRACINILHQIRMFRTALSRNGLSRTLQKRAMEHTHGVIESGPVHHPRDATGQPEASGDFGQLTPFDPSDPLHRSA